jgi:hypothetical protein
VKYSGLRKQLAALRAQLPARGITIRITGGLPENWEPAKPAPPGADLKAQHRIFGRPARPPDASASPSEPTVSPERPSKRP